MDLFIINHPFRFETENLTRIFIKNQKINILFEKKKSDSYILTEAENSGERIKLTVEILLDGRKFSGNVLTNNDEDYKKNGEYDLMKLLYELLTKAVEYSPQWGMLTGIRPAKFYRNTEKRVGKESVDEYFEKKYFLSGKKLALTKEVADAEAEILAKSEKNGYSLYVSIPFCPTRCLYCSFVSHSIEKTKKLIVPYVRLLGQELERSAEAAKRAGLKLQSIYFGGGTPTSLTAEQLEFLMNTIRSNFDLSNLLEYTIEAGRPDTITQEKLRAIKKGGATRISINPQTASNEVLKIIGRNHTYEDFCEKFELARREGFDNINTDLIAGLPGDNHEGFSQSINKLIEKNPENITVHTLSIKRSSALGEHSVIHSSQINEMLDYAQNHLKSAGYNPYYMYRQSNSAGNLENVGYSKPSKEGIYNVFIMDEIQTIIACGAGGVTKLKNPYGEEIKRIFNYKYPYEYNDKFEDILNRKAGIGDFYEKLYLQP